MGNKGLITRLPVGFAGGSGGGDVLDDGELTFKTSALGVRKRKKQMVADENKDEKYWERRRKNNMAAKRSRDARRAKETHVAMRASYLEQENKGLAHELSQAKAENQLLRERLCKYEPV